MEKVVPGNSCTISIIVPISRSMIPSKCGNPKAGTPARSHAGHSTWIMRGLPLIGQSLHSEPFQPGPLVGRVCAGHSPTDNAEGGSSVTTSPTTHRDATFDRDRGVRPADRLAVPIIHHLHIDHRVIHLHLLQQSLDHRRLPARRPQHTNLVGALARRGDRRPRTAPFRSH
ncbi:hypothetical protein ACN3XK_72370 [Actinomadura welshii]